jgi:hypothetical protein
MALGPVETDLASWQEALPEGGLYPGEGWLYSPEPLRLSRKEARFLDGFGVVLAKWVRACEEIYLRSHKGSLPAWIAQYLDAGKPPWMVELGKSRSVRGQFPRVLRPDLLLAEGGFSMTELDNVPGGMGITSWLLSQFEGLGADHLVGSSGEMLKGFRMAAGERGDVVISEESGDYRLELSYLVDRTNETGAELSLQLAESSDWGKKEEAYRFFELFDWQELPRAREIYDQIREGKSELRLSPPPRAFLEEKLWLALLWSAPLREVWRRGMRDQYFRDLLEVVPRGWVVDPAPIPHHAVIPQLEIQDWRELAEFSQKDRDLVLKVSGFSETAWGSKGVFVGRDLSQQEWAKAVSLAVDSFDTQPHVLQVFRGARRILHPYFDRETGEVRQMDGRARLCPYYFWDGETRPVLGGILATIVPADKKLIHGMNDGIMTVCAVN